MFDVQLKGADFKEIHNALYDLGRAVERLDGIVNPDLLGSLGKVEERIRAALKDAYKQDDDLYVKRRDLAEAVQDECHLKSIWSIYDTDDFYAAHPYKGVTEVHYRTHWGPAPVRAAIPGDRWIDLYRAADECICISGDEHHVFIENFSLKDGVLYLHTGS